MLTIYGTIDWVVNEARTVGYLSMAGNGVGGSGSMALASEATPGARIVNGCNFEHVACWLKLKTVAVPWGFK